MGSCSDLWYVTAGKYFHSSLQLCRFGTNDFTLRTHNCGELRLTNEGQSVTLYGWLQYKRGSMFFVLRDAYGSTQIRIPEERQDLSKFLKDLYLESIIKVNGDVVDRGDQRNMNMPTGNIEVVARNIELVNEFLNPEKTPYSLRFEQSDALRLKYRYMDLRSEKMQRNLRLRAKVVQNMRNYLDNEVNFVEVETPTLVRRTPGGAREFIVPSPFPNLGKFYSLPQSPQQFKQLLMCGGFDRYYQFARCYRDEKSKSDRQPEFTQVDLELSFTNQDGVISLVENLIKRSWPLDGFCPFIPFQRISFDEAYRLYGTDKPDLRIPWTIEDCTDYFFFLNSQNMEEFCVRFIVAKGAAKYLADAELKSWHQTKMDKKCQTNYFISGHKIFGNDMFICSSWGTPKGVQWTLGELRNIVGEAAHLRSQQRFEFVWITDFPLFFQRSDGSFKSVHHPFTAPVSNHEELMYDPSRINEVKGQHYDLVLNGVELGGGSIRIHNPKLQRYVIENILKEPVDELKHLIDALACGAPPHGGFALGFDRYIALLAGTGNINVPIRDVIAFPKNTEKRDIMMRSPSALSSDAFERKAAKLRYAIKLDASLISPEPLEYIEDELRSKSTWGETDKN
ncbi:unnamed protein product [Dracunculus medinensis]|uniref:AA_TRNA_LIGASE_II domain-containing protein n=1 Tax=Dracunculus medinensis TaxID=318479 RepID=A0A0N4URJ9_DRAME|nr:unnamed protein product [Dracunculus medinensis]